MSNGAAARRGLVCAPAAHCVQTHSKLPLTAKFKALPDQTPPDRAARPLSLSPPHPPADLRLRGPEAQPLHRGRITRALQGVRVATAGGGLPAQPGTRTISPPCRGRHTHGMLPRQLLCQLRPPCSLSNQPPPRALLPPLPRPVPPDPVPAGQLLSRAAGAGDRHQRPLLVLRALEGGVQCSGR